MKKNIQQMLTGALPKSHMLKFVKVQT